LPGQLPMRPRGKRSSLPLFTGGVVQPFLHGETCLSDQTNATQAAAAAYFPISPRSTPVMAEEPASKPFHVIPTQQTKRAKLPNRPALSGQVFCGGFEFKTSPFPPVTQFGYPRPCPRANFPSPGRWNRWPADTGLSMPMAWSWHMSMANLLVPLLSPTPDQ
jgi:hypothetical protein